MLQMILYNIDDCLIWNFIIRKNLLPIPSFFFRKLIQYGMNLWNIFGKGIRKGEKFPRYKYFNYIPTINHHIVRVSCASSYFQTGTEINRRNIEYFADNISFESQRNIDIFLNKELMAGQTSSTETNFCLNTDAAAR